MNIYIFKEPPGVHIFDFEKYDLLTGWGKIWRFAKKKREYKGEEMENEEIFTVPMGKNIIFFKWGGGAKISYFGQIIAPGSPSVSPLILHN